jgi:outer membrane protein TolC
MKPTLTLLFMMLAARGAAAQEPVLLITLDEAVTRVVANSYRLAELQARRQGAEAAEAGRAAASLPALALAGGYTRTNHVDEFGIAQPGQPLRVIYPDIPDNYRARIDLNWPVYSGGRIDALERAATAELHAAGEDLTAARLDLRLEAARAFWALVSANETEHVVTRSLDTVAAHLRDLRSRFEQGLIPPNDVLSAEAQESRQRVLAIDARNTRAICEADLRRLIGLETRDRIRPVATTTDSSGSDSSADGLLEEARTTRPERRALANRSAASHAREDAARAAARPQVGVNAGYDYARPNPRIPDGGDYWRQAVFYKLMVEHYGGNEWKVASVIFDFIEPSKKKEYQREKLVIDEEDVRQVKEQINSVSTRIENRDFYTGCGKEDCHWCAFVKTNKLAVALHELQAEEDENEKFRIAELKVDEA